MEPKFPPRTAWVVLASCALLAAYGPIPQPAGYHGFADRSVLLGLPHGADVLSNLGFALVGLWGLARLAPRRTHPALRAGWPGHALFLGALVLTAAGSAWYHLAPDDARLVWDRIPIGLACAGLLAAVRAESRSGASARAWSAGLALFAVAGVAWWHFGNRGGAGDLRPYLLLQGLPLVLVPLWQRGAPAADRRAFGAALLCYVAAKFAELGDRTLFALLGGALSGHTLKHLLATLAAALIVARLAARLRGPPGAGR